MKRAIKDYWKKCVSRVLAFLIAYVGQPLLKLILWTCKVEVEGLDTFVETANQHKCILMLWHNRLALVPYALSTFAPQFIYAAFVSKSRDGALLAAVANSYSAGRVISVPHQARHHALKEMIRRLEENREIMLVTPDGPRGPAYQVKSGVTLAAQLASAHVIPWIWSADKCWKLKTWDKLMLPKPFSKITVTFGTPVLVESDDVKVGTEVLQRALQTLTAAHEN